MLEYRSYGEFDADRCPTSQTVNGNEVEEPKEELIAHQDGTKQVAQDQGSEVFLGIREPIECCHDDSGQVEQGYECEELAIGIEPELEEDPSADFPLWRRWFLLYWLIL